MLPESFEALLVRVCDLGPSAVLHCDHRTTDQSFPGLSKLGFLTDNPLVPFFLEFERKLAPARSHNTAIQQHVNIVRNDVV